MERKKQEEEQNKSERKLPGEDIQVSGTIKWEW
jgi:hypothetical protein